MGIIFGPILSNVVGDPEMLKRQFIPNENMRSERHTNLTQPLFSDWLPKLFYLIESFDLALKGEVVSRNLELHEKDEPNIV
jgi:hypothetical protein